MLTFAVALAGDFLGGYALLRLTRRWWLVVLAAICIGIVSGAVATFAVGMFAGVPPGRLLAAMIRSASLHAILMVVGCLVMRWWLSPRTG